MSTSQDKAPSNVVQETIIIGAPSNLYLGPLTVNNSSANFGGVSVSNVSSISVLRSPVRSEDLTNKQYVDDQLAHLATDRLDALLAGSNIQLDTLVEIVDYFNGLDAAASGNVSTAVSNLQNSLNTETSRAQGVEASLQANVDSEEYRAKHAEGDLQASINAEAVRAQVAESDLQASIDAEAARAAGEEGLIRGELGAEAARALAAESGLQANIDAESVRATGEEGRIDAKLDIETSRAFAAEIQIQANLDAALATANAYSTQTRARLDAIYQYFKRTYSNVNPSTGAPQ